MPNRTITSGLFPTQRVGFGRRPAREAESEKEIEMSDKPDDAESGIVSKFNDDLMGVICRALDAEEGGGVRSEINLDRMVRVLMLHTVALGHASGCTSAELRELWDDSIMQREAVWPNPSTALDSKYVTERQAHPRRDKALRGVQPAL